MTSTTPTAGLLLRQLSRSALSAELSHLDALDDTARALAVRALASVPRGSRVDVHVLVASVRAEAAREHAHLRARTARAEIQDRLDQMAACLAAHDSPVRGAFSSGTDPVDDEPDDELDDEPARKKPIARIRFKRRGDDDSTGYLGPKMFGAGDTSRPYGCPVGADYDSWRSPSRPPWLLEGELDDHA